MLPEAYLRRMRELLGDEYPAFERELFEGSAKRGLRVNTLKLTPAEFLGLSPFPLTPSPLCRDAFILDGDARAGLHPYHHAGLYYMQEPSASAVVEALEPQPGRRVLDLCAAPGGKSTHIAARLQRQGLLISNECVSSRVRALSSNMERIGARNCAVVSAMPERLLPLYGDCFDAVVVDAPCSGEGMFRREPEAVANWSKENVKSCARRQLLILDEAAKMTAGGGILMYSTCTLSPEEDEGVVAEFLASHPDFFMEAITAVALPLARPEWAGAPDPVALAARLMPHLIPGEGHFIARLRRDGDFRAELPQPVKVKALSKEQKALFEGFWRESFYCEPWCEPVLRGDTVWLSPGELCGAAAIRPGVPAGSFIKGRFEPEHGLYMALRGCDMREAVELEPEDGRIAAFLRGETIEAGGRGYRAVCVKAGGVSYPIGFGKVSGGVLKNHYPKGLRNLK